MLYFGFVVYKLGLTTLQYGKAPYNLWTWIVYENAWTWKLKTEIDSVGDSIGDLFNGDGASNAACDGAKLALETAEG